MIITIDGPGGCGKTTVAKRVADKLDIAYFDTGALYRAFAWYINDKNSDKIEELLESFDFKIKRSQKEVHYLVDGKDITTLIRTPEISSLASQVAAKKEVREALKPLQKLFAADNDVVFEGRDLGSVIFPEAEVKIFLTARPDVRARRRYEELKVKYPDKMGKTNFETVYEELLKRDEADSNREIAPLIRPQGAFEIDTSDLSINEVVEQIVAYQEEKQ